MNLPLNSAGSKGIEAAKRKSWTDHQYLIVDELSMMDCNMLMNLNKNLCEMKTIHDQKFGEVNLIFLGDFFQSPTVSTH